MEPKAWDIHVVDCHGGIECSELHSKPDFMHCQDTGSVSTLKQFAKAFVPEGHNHGLNLPLRRLIWNELIF